MVYVAIKSVISLLYSMRLQSFILRLNPKEAEETCVGDDESSNIARYQREVTSHDLISYDMIVSCKRTSQV